MMHDISTHKQNVPQLLATPVLEVLAYILVSQTDLEEAEDWLS